MSKSYGLILPGQQKKKPISKPLANARPTIFDESSSSSSDSNDDNNATAAPSKLKPMGQQKVVATGPSMVERRMARRVQEQALAEDPTIFQYDELYDDMESQREDEKQTKRNEPREAKYIGRLMEHAERRKLENELRMERQVQKEREAEGETYKDKDTYVTTAYRKRLEEMRKMQEQDERDDYLEAIGDVTKQKDLDGFYRHLYEQKTGGSSDKKVVIKPDMPKKFADSIENYAPIKSIHKQQRAYRKRRISNDSVASKKSDASVEDKSKNRTTTNKKAHLHNNIDADSDFSIDSSESEGNSSDDDKVKNSNKQDTKKEMNKQKQENGSVKRRNTNKIMQTKSHTVLNQANVEQPTIVKGDDGNDGKTTDKDDNDVQSTKDNESSPLKFKSKFDKEAVWRKRTIGDVFEAALQRYYKRKAKQA